MLNWDANGVGIHHCLLLIGRMEPIGGALGFVKSRLKPVKVYIFFLHTCGMHIPYFTRNNDIRRILRPIEYYKFRCQFLVAAFWLWFPLDVTVVVGLAMGIAVPNQSF